ncbi:hypothetical protein NDU88_005821 [Pleurodeles waltl]|uniref:Uncharacterized protein n=1 Tax=Pleurodeles waltl TaxID=8319 RepID=A0AAV7LMI1_PLEWA|nr:hypothetical protein NDU88_005821 [Pleurodeles waltl]
MFPTTLMRTETAAMPDFALLGRLYASGGVSETIEEMEYPHKAASVGRLVPFPGRAPAPIWVSEWNLIGLVPMSAPVVLQGLLFCVL